MYLPQEPTFLNGTIRDNFLAASPELDEEGMNRVLRDAGLGPFIDESPKGLETEIANVGLSLALGIRRRLPLARATATGGRLVVFDEPTPIALIRELGPDVLVKGADYQEAEIVGADLTRARGGRVLRVPLEPGLSTTALIERARRSTEGS